PHYVARPAAIDCDDGVQTSAGFKQLGIETIAPIARRGVLRDVARDQRLEPDYEITPTDFEQAASTAKVEIRSGDVVLVRTGYGALWSNPDQYMQAAGVSAAGSRWLIEKKVSAVGADNMAFDVTSGPRDPELNATLPGHLLLLVRAGIPIIETIGR